MTLVSVVLYYSVASLGLSYCLMLSSYLCLEMFSNIA